MFLKLRNMTRPSNNLDEKMLESAKEILLKEGVSKLTVRNICKVSDVNTGMFSYHFTDKRNFFIKLSESIYEDYLKSLDLDELNGKNPLEKLKYCLEVSVKFSQNRDRMIASLLFDLIFKDRELFTLVRENVIGNNILIQIIDECKTKGIFKTSLPSIEIFAMFMINGIQPHMFYEDDVECSIVDYEGFKQERINILINGLLYAKESVK